MYSGKEGIKVIYASVFSVGWQWVVGHAPVSKCEVFNDICGGRGCNECASLHVHASARGVHRSLWLGGMCASVAKGDGRNTLVMASLSQVHWCLFLLIWSSNSDFCVLILIWHLSTLVVVVGGCAYCILGWWMAADQGWSLRSGGGSFSSKM